MMNFNNALWNVETKRGLIAIDGKMVNTKLRYQVLDATTIPDNPLLEEMQKLVTAYQDAVQARRTDEKLQYGIGYWLEDIDLPVGNAGLNRNSRRLHLYLTYGGKEITGTRNLAINIALHYEADEKLSALAESMMAIARLQLADVLAKEKAV